MSSSSPPRSASLLGSLLLIPVVIVGLALAVAVVITPLSLDHQAIFGVVVFVAAFVLSRASGRFVTLLLVTLSAIISSRYLFWRLTSTMRTDHIAELVLGSLLLFAEGYSCLVMWLGYIQSVWPLDRRPVPLPADPSKWPTVDVFIPTYNEPLSVVRTTVLAALALDWPVDKLAVYVLDDGRREDFRKFCEQAGAQYVTRPDNVHAKAGNINHALKQARGEFVAIFDSDHVPTRSYLQVNMGWMLQSSRMALVQSPHHFHSPDPFERNLKTFRRIPNEDVLFYRLLLPGDDLWNAVFFCGSCGLLRRSALDDVGGIATDTVTEDAHTALKLHRRGWESAYLAVPQASGLATENLAAHVGQRIRWGRGMVQILRVDNPFLGRGLRWAQRLCYANSMIHFLNGIPRLIFLTAPLAFLFFGLNVFNAGAVTVLAYALPHLTSSMLTNSHMQGRVRHSFWAEVYETALATYIFLPTMLALINPKLGKFNVTAKGGLIEHEYYDWRIARPYVMLLFLNLVGLAVGAWRIWSGHDPTDSVSINIGWTLYNLVIIGAVLAVARETQQRRMTNRIAVNVRGMLRLATGHTLPCTTRNLSRGGAMLDVQSDRSFAPGEELHLSLCLGDEVALPARVIAHDKTTLRLQFGKLTLAQEAGLVRAIYSRADAWLDWYSSIQRDRVILSWLGILRHSLRGMSYVLLRRKAA